MSERIARRAAQRDALGLSDTRGKRFEAQITQRDAFDFNALVAVPRWLTMPAAAQTHIALAAALLPHKARLDQEVSGQKLAAMAEVVGEDLFDAITALPAVDDEAGSPPLPRPDALLDQGWALLHRALPASLASRFPGAANDAVARRYADQAVMLVEAL